MRLLLVLAVVCLYLVALGTVAVETDYRHPVDTHWGRGLSSLQIGWRWVHRLLGPLEPIPIRFRLSPDPDPAPIILPRARRHPPTWIEWQPTSPVFLLVSSAL